MRDFPLCLPSPPPLEGIDPCQVEPPFWHSRARLSLRDWHVTGAACQEGTDESLGKMGRTPAHVAIYWDYRSEVRCWRMPAQPARMDGMAARGCKQAAHVSLT